MLEITKIEDDVNIFNLSRRPLKICNINRSPQFKPISTRIPCLQAIQNERKRYAEAAWEQEILPPIDDDKYVNGNSKEAVYSDHFNRDFEEIALPSVEHGKMPILKAKNSCVNTKPHWHTDVPTTNLHYQKKINIRDVSDPLLTIKPPKCDVCLDDLEYPFYANPNHNICVNCYANARLPPYTSTKDLFRVDEPKYTDGSWTLAETNKLLSIIEEIGDDWQTISQQMKNRSPAECCLHFIRLPIMDQFYNDDVRKVEETDEINQHYIPFLMAPHPIAAFVQFVDIYNAKLGSAVAEASNSIIEQLLKANNSNIPITEIPIILTKILERTKAHASQLADEEGDLVLELLNQVHQKLDKMKYEHFEDILSRIKNLDVIQSSVSFNIPIERPEQAEE